MASKSTHKKEDRVDGGEMRGRGRVASDKILEGCNGSAGLNIGQK